MDRQEVTFTEEAIWEEVRRACSSLKSLISPYTIMAICEQESEKDKWNRHIYRPEVARLEQGFYRRYIMPKSLSTPTEVLLSASYGISQMMGESLRAEGYFNQFALSRRLLLSGDTLTGEVVMRALEHYVGSLIDQVDMTIAHYLSKLNDAQGDEANALLRWNGGGNQNYPNEVLARKLRLQERLEL